MHVIKIFFTAFMSGENTAFEDEKHLASKNISFAKRN